MDRFQPIEKITVEMLEVAADYLRSAAGHASEAGVDSPTADYISEIDLRSRQVADMAEQMKRDIQ
jgi:high-affinity K+ transport system ATPase subunit B